MGRRSYRDWARYGAAAAVLVLFCALAGLVLSRVHWTPVRSGLAVLRDASLGHTQAARAAPDAQSVHVQGEAELQRLADGLEKEVAGARAVAQRPFFRIEAHGVVGGARDGASAGAFAVPQCASFQKRKAAAHASVFGMRLAGAPVSAVRYDSPDEYTADVGMWAAAGGRSVAVRGPGGRTVAWDCPIAVPQCTATLAAAHGVRHTPEDARARVPVAVHPGAFAVLSLPGARNRAVLGGSAAVLLQSLLCAHRAGVVLNGALPRVVLASGRLAVSFFSDIRPSDSAADQRTDFSALSALLASWDAAYFKDLIAALSADSVDVAALISALPTW